MAIEDAVVLAWHLKQQGFTPQALRRYIVLCCAMLSCGLHCFVLSCALCCNTFACLFYYCSLLKIYVMHRIGEPKLTLDVTLFVYV